MRKLGFMLFIIGMFLWAGNALAYPGIPKSGTMLFVGICLIVIAGFGRKKFLKK